MENIFKKIYVWTEWVMYLFLLQIFWLGGTIIGGIIFGVVPASIALLSSIRKLHREPQELNLVSYFIKEYRLNFKISLVLTFWYFIAISLGFVYLQFIRATTDTWLAYTHILLYVILFLVFLLFLYLIPVYVHYEISLKNLLPTTGAIMVTGMKWNLPLLLSLTAISLIFIRFSIVFFFFGSSSSAFVVSYFTKRAFNDFDLKREYT